MVRGRGIAVTAVALMYQCAETTRIACGRGTAWPNALHAEVYRLVSSAFIGLPWPKKAAGMVAVGLLVVSVLTEPPEDGTGASTGAPTVSCPSAGHNLTAASKPPLAGSASSRSLSRRGVRSAPTSAARPGVHSTPPPCAPPGSLAAAPPRVMIGKWC